MGYVFVLKTTDYFSNGIGFSNVAEKFIPQTFALGGTCNEACNIDETHNCRDDAFGMIHIRKDGNALIGNFYDPDIRFDSAERIVCRFGTGFGYGIEQRAFSDIR